MSTILFTKEIGNKIRSLCWDNLQGTLNLKVAQLGDVQFYESAKELDDLLPAIFVKPSPGVEIKIRTQTLLYTVTYRYRIIFVTTFDVGDNVVEDKIDAVNSIAELLFNNTRLTGLTLSNGIIEKMIPISMEYEPIEEGFLTLLKGNYVASVVNLQVDAHTATA